MAFDKEVEKKFEGEKSEDNSDDEVKGCTCHTLIFTLVFISFIPYNIDPKA